MSAYPFIKKCQLANCAIKNLPFRYSLLVLLKRRTATPGAGTPPIPLFRAGRSAPPFFDRYAD